MKLIVFNGSPRGSKSNTQEYIDHFLNGFNESDKTDYELSYLKNTKELDYHRRQFYQASNILIGFPLYFDTMPALVKSFFESLDLSQIKKDTQVGFIIQSGFPEPTHCKYLVRYLSKLIAQMNCKYIGSIIRGGGEGIRVIDTIHNPIHKIIHFVGKISNIGRVGYYLNNKRTFRIFYSLGKYFGEFGEFNSILLDKLSKPYKLSRFGFMLYRLIAEKMYFNILLKRNNAFKERYAGPYSITNSFL